MGSMGLGGWVVGLVVKGFALTPPKHPKCSQPNVKRGYFSPLSLANFSVGLFSVSSTFSSLGSLMGFT